MTQSVYLQDYAALANELPGQHLAWLHAQRQAALSRFGASGFPSPREEDWKYTNVSAIERKRFKPSAGPVKLQSGDLADVDGYRLKGACCLVLVDGRFCAEASSLQGIPEGVTVTAMANALQDCPERVAAGFGRTLENESHGFIAFNTALFTDGVFVDVPCGVRLENPLQIMHVNVSAEGLSNTRSMVMLGRGAEASLVETFLGQAGQSYLTAAVIELCLGENAGLDHYKVQLEADKAYHFGGVYVSQGRDSRFRQHNLAFGGLLARTEIHASLGSGAECRMNGLFLADGRQHVDNHTLIQHCEPHGVSEEIYRGVLSGRARGVFQGRIVVHPHAQKTQAVMNNRNLLLSDDAEIDTKPQLEILADDVKCGHGVTVGQLNPESVYYLESRGIDQESARNMLTFAFANELVEKISLSTLRGLVQEQLLKRLPQAGIRREWL